MKQQIKKIKIEKREKENIEISSAKAKKAQGHVEMILSFVLFIGFVFAIFIFLNPVKENKVSFSSLDAVQKVLFNNLSIDYQDVSLILSNNPVSSEVSSEKCFSVSDKLDLSGNLTVKDINGNTLSSLKGNNNKISIQIPTGEADGIMTDKTFYKLYFSDSFNQNFNQNSFFTSGSCKELDDKNYTFGVLSFEKSLLYENLIALNNSYFSDYEALKKSLAIKNNFEFIVYNSSRDTLLSGISAKQGLKLGQVLAREIPLKIIDRNANQANIIFNLRVW